MAEHQFLYPDEFLALFASSTIISVIQYWLQSDMKQTPEQLAQMITVYFFPIRLKAFGFPPYY